MPFPLQPGESIILAEHFGRVPPYLVFGVGWDPAPPQGMIDKALHGEERVDIDAVCVVFDADGSLQEIVDPTVSDHGFGAVQHTGDHRTGAGSGDDESIFIALNTVPETAHCLVLGAVLVSGQRLGDIKGAFGRLYETDQQTELAWFDLSAGGAYTSALQARLIRDPQGNWVAQGIGQPGKAESADELAELASQFAR